MDENLWSLFKIEKIQYPQILDGFKRYMLTIDKNGCTLTVEAKGLELIEIP